MLYLLDTDICSYIIKKRPIDVLETLQDKVASKCKITISSISYSELLLGAMRSQHKAKHLKLISAFRERIDSVLAWDEGAAQSYAVLQSQLWKKGSPIGVNDTMIASHALSIDATVVTNNTKHFGKVPKLSIENWV